MYKKPTVVDIPENPTEEEETKLHKRAYNTCLWHLERSDKTSGQLQEKLQRKGFTSTYITPTLKKLEEEGYVDDTKYAEKYIDSKLGQKGMSVIRMELLQKGVDKDIITHTVERYEEELSRNEETVEEIEINAAQNLAKMRAERMNVNLPYSKKLNRIVGVLARRGFSSDIYGIATEAIKQYSTPPETSVEDNSW